MVAAAFCARTLRWSASSSVGLDRPQRGQQLVDGDRTGTSASDGAGGRGVGQALAEVAARASAGRCRRRPAGGGASGIGHHDGPAGPGRRSGRRRATTPAVSR